VTIAMIAAFVPPAKSVTLSDFVVYAIAKYARL